MIGQSSIIGKFNTFDKLPSAMILIGPTGSGKKTLLKTLTSMLWVDIVHINKVLSDELKSELYSHSNKCIVAIDLTLPMQYKQNIAIQNSILKFAEETPKNFKLIILANDESSLLNTLLNRCYIQKLDEYSKRELFLIAKDNNLISYKTYSDKEFEYMKYPIDILLDLSLNMLNSMESLVDTIFSSIGKANISNTLSISKKIDFNGDNNDLYNLNIFMNIFNYKLLNLLKTSYDIKYYDTFKLFNILQRDITKANINKSYLFEKFLLDIKYILV